MRAIIRAQFLNLLEEIGTDFRSTAILSESSHPWNFVEFINNNQKITSLAQNFKLFTDIRIKRLEILIGYCAVVGSEHHPAKIKCKSYCDSPFLLQLMYNTTLLSRRPWSMGTEVTISWLWIKRKWSHFCDLNLTTAAAPPPPPWLFFSPRWIEAFLFFDCQKAFYCIAQQQKWYINHR